jgi:histidinol phosphatase-like enzyme
MAINAKWHKANRMPKNPTFEQRMKWHIAHMENCNCRKPSPKLLEEMKKFGSGV